MPHTRSRFVPKLEVLESRLAPDGKVTVVTAGGSAILLGDEVGNQVQIDPVPGQPGKFTIAGLNGTEIQLNKETPTASVVVENVQRFGGTLKGGNDSVQVNDLQGLKELKIDTGKGQNEVSIGGTSSFTQNVEITGENNKVTVTGDTTVGGDLKIRNDGKTGINDTDLATNNGDKLTVGGGLNYKTQTKGDTVDTFSMGNATQRGAIGKDVILNTGGGAATVFINNFDVNGKAEISTQNGADQVDGTKVNVKKGAKINGKNGNDVLSLNDFQTEGSLALDSGGGAGNQVNLSNSIVSVNVSIKGENNAVAVSGHSLFSGSFSVLNSGKTGANSLNFAADPGDMVSLARDLTINSANNGAGSNTYMIGNLFETTLIGGNASVSARSGMTAVNMTNTKLEKDLLIKAKDAVFQQAIFNSIEANKLTIDGRQVNTFLAQDVLVKSDVKVTLGKANVELERVEFMGKTKIQTTVPTGTFSSFLINDSSFLGIVDLAFLGSGLGSFLIEAFTTAANVATQFQSNLNIMSGGGELDGAMGFKDGNGVIDPTRQVNIGGNLNVKGGKGAPNSISLFNAIVDGTTKLDDIVT